MPLVRFLPPGDHRIRGTVLAISDELTEDGIVLRYRTDETDDGLSGEEGTFAICSFWLVSALCEIGDIEAATQLLEKLLSYASPLLLYAEEIDPVSGRHLGNFPQAFTHLALINAVMHVIRAEEQLAEAPAQRDPSFGSGSPAPAARAACSRRRSAIRAERSGRPLLQAEDEQHGQPGGRQQGEGREVGLALDARVDQASHGPVVGSRLRVVRHLGGTKPGAVSSMAKLGGALSRWARAPTSAPAPAPVR